MIFALVLLPAAAGAIKGIAAGVEKYRLGKDIKENKQALMPAALWNMQDWKAMPKEAMELYQKSMRKNAEVEAAKRQKETQ